MLIQFEIQKKREYWLLSIFSALLYGILAYVLGVKLLAAIVIGLLLLCVLNFRIHFREEVPLWVAALICGVYSFIIYLELQLAVGSTIWKVSFIKTIVNWAVIFALILLVTAACGHLRYALIGVQTLLIILGIANHMVVQTRGMEIQFADIFSITTAMSVAGSYTYVFSVRTIGAIFLTLITTLFLCLNRLPKIRPLKIRIGSLAVSATALSLAVLLVSTSWGTSLIGYRLLYWKLQSSDQNGFLVSLIHSISAAKVNRPSGYSKDTLEDLLTEYLDQLENPPTTDQPTDPSDPEIPTDPEQPSDSKSEQTVKPNIIVIMNETFSDLAAVANYLGFDMQTDSEVMPFFSSLSDDESNIAKGFAMASVFGGNTANSEFEFLTGNSMAFLPANTVAYNLYLNSQNAFSVVDILKKSGYTTVGMHPEVSSNWNRAKLYEYFGFDQTYFLETDRLSGAECFVNSDPLVESDYYREHVSDSTVYKRIIELYEQKEEGSPLFTFAVTMQNHGGYTSSNFDYTVKLESEGSSASVNEYLSSIQNADAALQELITYFEAQEEDTLIIFFGDHQPSLPASFYTSCLGLTDDSPADLVQAKYAVPYLFWGNFDFESQFEEITSLNYLSSHMLEIAGVEKTEFLKFTDLVEQEVIAINAFGWWDKDLVFHSFAAEDSDTVSLLRLYKYLQYNELFDQPDDKLISWFVLPSDTAEELDAS